MYRLYFIFMVVALLPLLAHGADVPPVPSSRLSPMRAAEALVSRRDKGMVGQRVVTGEKNFTRVASTISFGPIAIAAVTLVGSTDPSAVACYGRMEFEVVFSALTVASDHYYEPIPERGGIDLMSTFTSPDGRFLSIPGYWDGSSWRLRFAPDTVGAWSYRVAARDASGTANWTGGSFTCLASSSRGFIRVDGKRLAWADGQTFHGVGHNNGWLPVVEQPAFTGKTPAIPAYGTVPAIDELPADRSMSANNEDLLSFWLCSPWETASGWWPQRAPIENIEQGIGIYNQTACAYLDEVVDRAEKSGIQLLPSIWAHDQLRAAGHPWGAGSWANNAYSAICNANDFMKTQDTSGNDTEQWLRQKAFYRYLLARWGASTAVLGWVGVVEIEGTSAYRANRNLADQWCVQVRQWFGDHDPYRAVSGHYPIVFSRLDWTGRYYDPNSALDVLVTDSYASSGDDLLIATVISNNITDLRSHGKPCFHTEFGGDFSDPSVSQPDHLHNGLWADAAAGGAVSPLVWCDGQSFPRLVSGSSGLAMQSHLSCHANILDQISFLGANDLTCRSEILSDSTKVWMQIASDHGFAWIFSASFPQANLGGQSFTLSGVSAGDYDVCWFDTWGNGQAPQLIQQVTASHAGLTVTVPTLNPARPDQFFVFKSRLINQVPQVIDSALEGISGQPITVTLTATDAETAADQLVYQVMTGPTHGSLSGSGSSLIYTSATDFVGTDTVIWRANDGTASSVDATVTIVCTSIPINHVPQVTDSAVEGISGQSITVTLTATDVETPADQLVYQVVTGPTHGSLSGSGSSLIYTSATDFVGTDTVVWRANDGTASSVDATVNVTIRSSSKPVSQPPSSHQGGCGLGSGLAVMVSWLWMMNYITGVFYRLRSGPVLKQ